MIKNIKYFTGFLFLSVGCTNYRPHVEIASETVSMAVVQQTPKSTQPDEGNKIYLNYCLSCHQKDGTGVPGMYPPLQKSDWVNGDKKKIINALINGLEGDIKVNNELYSSVMPKQSYLTNRQISQVLSYVRKNFGNHADSVTLKDVSLIRK